MMDHVRARLKPWDMILAGGGATGVCVAINAATRGNDVLSLEPSDFGANHGDLNHGDLKDFEVSSLRSSWSSRFSFSGQAKCTIRLAGMAEPVRVARPEAVG